MQNLEVRLARVEREARVWRIAALLFGAVLVAAASPAPSGEVRTRNFILEGPDGAPRATFAELADGTLGLILMDKSGSQRASLGLSADGSPALKLVGPSKGYAALAVGKDGAAVLGLKSNGSAELSALPEGQLGMTLSDAGGHPRATVGLKDGTADALLLDKGGNGGVMIAVPGDQAPELQLRDKNGKELFGVPLRTK